MRRTCPSRRSTWSARSTRPSRRPRRSSKEPVHHGKPTIHVDVVSAEESIFSGEAKFVALPGEGGELGILPRHTPLITRIKPGAVRIERADNGEEEFVFVAGGILEVQPNCVTVFADTAIRGHDLDEAKATEAKKLAEEAMKNAKSDIDLAAAQSEFATMAAQLAAIQKLRRKTALRLPARTTRRRRRPAGFFFSARSFRTPNNQAIEREADEGQRRADHDDARDAPLSAP